MRGDIRRIAIVCQPWDHVAFNSSNSIVTVSYQLARCLAHDWHVTIYGRRKARQQGQEIDSENIEFRHIKIGNRPHAIVERFLNILAIYGRLTVNYALSQWNYPFYSVRVALGVRGSKCSVVLVHNFLQCAHIIKLFNPSVTVCLQMHCEWLTQYATASSERRLRKVDMIFGVSDYITEGIRRRFPAIAERCHTVYNGVDVDRFSPPLSAPPSDRTQSLLFVGRLSPEKGPHVLIKAFKSLAEKHPTLRLDFVGHPLTPSYLYLAPDPAMANLAPFYDNRISEKIWQLLGLKRRQAYMNALVTEASGDDRIVFHSAVSHSETIAFYRQAAVVVIPSVGNEPFGLPACEAAACQLPVVSTRGGGIPEIVEHGQTGLLVTRGDAEELAVAVSRIIDNPVLARAMGKAGRQRMLDRFTWEASTRCLVDLIENARTCKKAFGG